ncbi:MAG TPA: MFS transporter [Planctomycetota bacterium]|jgi:MFS family permease|nr:MFS transporter [Planctomycetota bacterium]
MPPPRASGRSPLLLIFLTVFIDLLGFGIVIPLLPLYSRVYHASETELGLLFGCFSGMQFVFAPMWGRLSDRIGRKPVLVGGLLGTAASYVLFALAGSMPLLFVSRLCAGFFGANVSTAQAYIADVTTPENRAKGMGLIGAAFGLGFTLGPWIGGELAGISSRAPGFLAAGLSLAAALFGSWNLVEPPRERRSASRIFHLDQVRRAFADGRIGIVLVLSFLFIFSFSAFESMFVLFGLERFPAVFDRDGTHDVLKAAPIVGRYMGLIGILSAIIQGGLIRRLVPRFGETTLAVVGPALLAISFLILGLAPNWSVVIVACVVMPLGFGLNNPALQSLVSRASPVDEQGAFLGLNQSMLSLARMTGPLSAGVLFTAHGAQVPFLAGAGVLVASALIAAAYRARYGATFPRHAPVQPAEV